VIKVEKAGEGDATRGQLRDIPDVDSLYFTMLNHNKRSITLDTKNPKGKEVLIELIKQCDVLVENFAPGALDRMGFSWETHPADQPAHDHGLGQGLRPRPVRGLQGLRERRAVRGRRRLHHRLRRRPAAGDRRPDRRLRHRPAPGLGIVTALFQREKTGRGQKVLAAMQDAVLNLCRVKLRDQQRLARKGVMEEYPQFPEGEFGDAVPRAGQCLGRRPAGLDPEVQGLAARPQRLHLLHHAGAGVGAICKVIGEESWITDPSYATPKARLPHLKTIFSRIEEWTKTKTKFEAMEILNKYDIPAARSCR
jgi:formyl-CoA transferase